MFWIVFHLYLLECSSLGSLEPPQRTPRAGAATSSSSARCASGAYRGDEASAKTQSIISGNTDFKAIGKYTADNAEQVATKIRSKHITAYELDSIPAGQGIFYFKIGDAVPVKVKVHDHLVLKGREDDYAMSWSDFAGVEQNQRQLYYRKPGDYSSLSATPIKSLVNEIDTVADPEARQEWQPTKSFPKPENDSDRKRKRYYPAFDDLE